MAQFSDKIDAELNNLSRNITEADEVIENATKHKDEDWERVLEIFSEFNKTRFLASDGHVLAQQKRERKPLLNEDKLYAELVKIYGRRQASRLWGSITKTVVDPVLLEKMVQSRHIDAAIVVGCMEEQEPIIARTHPKWTQEDYNRAIVLGVKRDEVEE